MNNSDKFEYSVVRSRRKSICIELDRDLNIKVRAPLRMTDSQIQSFVDSRQNWIRRHLEIMQKRISNMSDKKKSKHCPDRCRYKGTVRTGSDIYSFTCRTFCSDNRRDLRKDHHQASEDPLGKLQLLR